MMTCDRRTLNTILKHKEYFDNKLIEICSKFEKDIISLTSQNTDLKRRVQTYMKENAVLTFKMKDIKTLRIIAEDKYKVAKNENDELLDILDRLKKEIDELKKENEQQRKDIDKAIEENKRQKKDIENHKKKIKEQLGLIDRLKHMNSTNSNLPSSLDIMSHTKAKSQVKLSSKTGRTRGGQVSHSLHKSRISPKIDKVIEIRVKRAPQGAVPVFDDAQSLKYYVTQEVGLTLKSQITETRYYIDETAKKLDEVIMKKYAINPLVYSRDFKAATVYLNQKGTIPLQRLCDMMYEISKGSIQLRPGTIVNWCKECWASSKERNKEILEDILNSAIAHVDETGVKINGEQYWIQVITNDKGAIYLICKKRGDKEKGVIKLLEAYSGVLVHDHFSSYQSLDQCLHAECNAHIDRYLQGGIDFEHNEECEELLKLLHEILHRKHELEAEGKTEMSAEEITKYEVRYEGILERGIKRFEKAHPDMEKRYEPDYIKTFRRMQIYKEDHLRFMKDFKVPYTNNAAELQCRAVKGKKNISKQFVTEDGGKAYVSILSLLQTAKKRQENALETLEGMFN